LGVYRRRGKAWTYRFELAGRVQKTGGYRLRQDAVDAEAARRVELGALPRGAAPAPMRLHAALARYRTRAVPRLANPRGAAHACRALAAYLPDRPLRRVTSEDLEAYVLWRLTEGRGRGSTPTTRRSLQPSTVNRDLDAFSAFWGWCQDQGWLPRGTNPARRRRARRARGEGVARAPEPWRPWQTLSHAQEARLWAALPHREGLQAELLLLLGVRRGVVLGLTWEQIDWTAGVIRYTSKRHSGLIPLSDRARAVLEGLGPQPAGRVFPARSDTMLRRAWARARVAIGMPSLRLHDLRVTLATRLARQGTDLRTIQAILGHATPTMSLRYTVTDLETQRAALQRVAVPGPDTIPPKS